MCAYFLFSSTSVTLHGVGWGCLYNGAFCGPSGMYVCGAGACASVSSSILELLPAICGMNSLENPKPLWYLESFKIKLKGSLLQARDLLNLRDNYLLIVMEADQIKQQTQ